MPDPAKQGVSEFHAFWAGFGKRLVFTRAFLGVFALDTGLKTQRYVTPRAQRIGAKVQNGPFTGFYQFYRFYQF